MAIDFTALPSPCYVVEEDRLRRNLSLLADVMQRARCRILLALKGFAMWPVASIVREYLPGVAASSTAEARLGREEFRGEVHAYAPAYSQDDMAEMVELVDTVIFNSLAQLRLHRETIRNAPRAIEIGLRINPEYAEVETELYNPCAPGSRLGIRAGQLTEAAEEDWADVDGLHFHTMCEQGAEVLARTLPVVEEKFARFFDRIGWINFGGGHHITRPGYNVNLLVELISSVRSRYGLDVILEPGEAIALNTGYLVCTVLDIVAGDRPVAILDASATCHMPDVLEMPYRPEILGGALPGEKPHTFRLGGLSCLAGDVVGDWSFDRPLTVGDRLVFTDMAHYTMVKTTTFNGVRLPSIALWRCDNSPHVFRRFGYEDYRNRLG
ncbi:MAG: carboxynorspermidine decarboxylase [Phycisphaerae bacterium]